MSREIKFRGLTKDGKWMYGWYMEHPFSDNPTVNVSVIVQGERPYEVIPKTVGQQTGLKDKNGKDLNWWERDLLRKGSDHPCAPIGIIKYDEQNAKWSIFGKSGSEFCGLAQAYINGWTKIGNIYENPEL